MRLLSWRIFVKGMVWIVRQEHSTLSSSEPETALSRKRSLQYVQHKQAQAVNVSLCAGDATGS